MSFSQPFFGDKAAYRKKQLTGYDDDTEFATLHWTRQLELKPLRDRWNDYGQYEKGDKSTYFDMDRDDNITIDKEMSDE